MAGHVDELLSCFDTNHALEVTNHHWEWMRTQNGTDAVCIGTRGMRINGIMKELGSEKVDVIKYSDDSAEYVKAALAPATVKEVFFDAERSCRVVVDADQLSLAIGKEGQNARLAARLTGCKIDIKTERY